MTLCAYYETSARWNMPGYDHHDEHEAEPGHYFAVPLPDEGSLKVPVCEEHAERLHYLYIEHKFVDPPGIDPRTLCDVCGVEWRRHGAGEAPKRCLYCRDSCGVDENGHPCGFCDEGKPLDTQKDWDNSWGQVARAIQP